MDKDLIEFEKRLDAHFEQSNHYNENLFNLGVELGKILARKEVQEYRPNAFVQFELSQIKLKLIQIKFDAKEKEYDRIKELLIFIIRNGLAEQINEFGIFEFNAIKSQQHILDISITNKFQFKLGNTKHITNYNIDSDLRADVKFINEISDALIKGNLPTRITIELECSNNDGSEVLYKADDVDKIFYLNLGINADCYTEEEFKAVADALDKTLTFLVLRIKNII